MGSMSLTGFLHLALQAGFWSGLHSQQLQHFRFSEYPTPRATSLANKMSLCRSLPILRPILCQTRSSISFSLSVLMTKTDTIFSFFFAAFSPKQTLNLKAINKAKTICKCCVQSRTRYYVTSPDLSNRTKPNKKPIEPNRTPIVRLGWAIEQNRTPILL